jgi:enamine deaminase RidA (YjgF/YER057c/UK114 family)
MTKTSLLIICIILFSCNNPSERGGSQSPLNTAHDAEAKIKSLGIDINSVSPPVGNYVNAVRTGNLIFLSGKGPKRPAVVDGKQTDGSFVTGKLGKELTVEEGYEAARYAGMQQLASLKAELGNLNRVKRIVKVMGMVNAVPKFTDHPKVINGFSDLMAEVFGERGKHARAAVGMSSLPGNWAVEIEMIVEVE